MLLVTFEESRPHVHASLRSLLAEAACEYREVVMPNRAQLVARVSGEKAERLAGAIRGLLGDHSVVVTETPYVLSGRNGMTSRTVVPIVPGLEIGAVEFVVMAGPCAVETLDQTRHIAAAVRSGGARILRGGAFKPRTSPFSFHGLGPEGLSILAQARRELDMPVVSELMDQRDLERVDANVDVIQIGMRNALNYALLRDVGRLRSRRPVVLKGGIGATNDEFLCAADHILAEGNPNVILCLRGTIGVSRESRSSLNIADIPVLRRRTHLPIVVDPSHVAGTWELVPAIAAAALVAGADGLLVEVHHDPTAALCDGCQSILPERFEAMMHRLRLLGSVMGRSVAPALHRYGAQPHHPFADLCLEAPPSRPRNDPARHADAASRATAGSPS